MTQKMLEEKLMKAFQVIHFSKYVALKLQNILKFVYNVNIVILNEKN